MHLKGLRKPQHGEMDTLLDEHFKITEYAEKHPETHDALRDAQCHEIAMQWVHHLT